MLRTILLASIAVVALAPAIAHAGYDHERNGFYLGFGIGGGGDQERYQNLPDDDGGGGVGNFRIGGALNRSVALGLETSGFTRNDDVPGAGTLQRSATVAAFGVTVFPAQNGYYLRGGVGFGAVKAEYRDAGLTLSGSENGLGMLFATGWEFRLTPKFALGPQIEWAGVAVDGDVVKSVSWVSLTAQLTWWW
ncbi:MAG: outer membrane beta-barrel protein [bacterium]